MTMKVPFLDLRLSETAERELLMEAMETVLRHGRLVKQLVDERLPAIPIRRFDQVGPREHDDVGPGERLERRRSRLGGTRVERDARPLSGGLGAGGAGTGPRRGPAPGDRD